VIRTGEVSFGDGDGMGFIGVSMYAYLVGKKAGYGVHKY